MILKVCRRFLSNSYTYTDLPEKSKLAFKTSCECFANKLNAKLPKTSKLDLSLQLTSGSNPQYHKHVLLLSSDVDAWQSWPSKLELSTSYPDNALGPLKEYLRDTNKGSGVLLNEIALEKEHSRDSRLRFLVLPDMMIYELGSNELKEFASFLGDGKMVKRKKLSFEDYLKPRKHQVGDVRSMQHKNNEWCQQDEEAKDVPVFQGIPFHSDIVLVCGHHNRDARCGELAPLIKKELNMIRPNLKVGMISHIGGHKFAGNLIYYKFNGLNDKGVGKVDGIWLSKVLPQHLPVIIDSLDRKVIIRDFFRGKISNYK